MDKERLAIILDNIMSIYDTELDSYTLVTDHYGIKKGGYVKYFDMNGIKVGYGIYAKTNDKSIILKDAAQKKIYSPSRNKYIFFYKDHVSITDKKRKLYEDLILQTETETN